MKVTQEFLKDHLDSGTLNRYLEESGMKDFSLISPGSDNPNSEDMSKSNSEKLFQLFYLMLTGVDVKFVYDGVAAFRLDDIWSNVHSHPELEQSYFVQTVTMESFPLGDEEQEYIVLHFGKKYPHCPECGKNIGSAAH